MKKIYIDKELWYIENFLTKEEIEKIMSRANEKNGWYITSRSPSIKNRFLGVDVELYPEGTICPRRGIDLSGTAIFPDEEKYRTNPISEDKEIFIRPGGIFDRLESVLPKQLLRNYTMQSFWPLSEKEIKNGTGGAYEWHYEKGHDGENDKGMTAAYSIYINDDYEGGVLEFLNQKYSITPKPGMLISIPMTEEWTHRVTPVTKGIRHTLYGVCYEDVYDREISSGESC